MTNSEHELEFTFANKKLIRRWDSERELSYLSRGPCTGPLQHTHCRHARDGVLSPTGDWPIYMVRLYIALVCNWRHTVLTYGEALADRIVSYRDILCDIVSYLSFSLMAVSCHHYKFRPICLLCDSSVLIVNKNDHLFLHRPSMV